MLNSKLLSAMGGADNYIEEVFSTWLYSGNGGTQTITNGINLGGRGGLVWIKNRNSGNAHGLWDTVRGAGTGGATASNRALSSNLTDAQGLAGLSANTDYLSAFTSSGFTVVDPGIAAEIANATGQNYVSWSFRDQPKFFDVVTYTGTGANRTIAHNLQSVPGCIIVKRTDNTGDWQVYHRSLANTQYMVLNSTAAIVTGATRWNSTTPTDTVFSLGTDTTVNASGGTYIAYLFAHNAGGFGESGTDNVISCGSFTTDGSGNATVNLGYEPQWLMTKSTNTTGNWVMVDVMRGWAMGNNQNILKANLSDAEAANSANLTNITATGIQSFSTFLGANNTYIYIAIRRGPMKVPESGTSVFSPNIITTSTRVPITTGFPIDWQFLRYRDNASPQGPVYDRLRGVGSNPDDTYAGPQLDTTTTGAEIINFNTRGWGNTGFVVASPTNTPVVYWNFRRAPGFFDEVCYTGNAVNNTARSHNLGAVPELIIFKGRSLASNWPVYCKFLNNQSSQNNWNLRLNTNAAQNNNIQIFGNQLPTASLFYTGGNSQDINFSGDTYVAYFFASCPGVSKVGSYTGTATTQQINCGFTAGSRFVMIKRIDSTGDWYVWDSARGIVAGNDPYLLLNSTANEVTSTDYVDTYSAGFEISSTAPAAINASGGTFIFLAIA